MPPIDERLRRDLDRAARPSAPDSRAQFEDVERRRARRTLTRKVQTAALVTVVLVGTAAGFSALLKNFSGAQTPAARTTTSSTPAAGATRSPVVLQEIVLPDDPTKVISVDGLGSPVCRGSEIQGNFYGGGTTYAYVFTKARDTGCPPAGGGLQVLVVLVPDATGRSSSLVVTGPLDCQTADGVCYVWADPDIDGDGKNEIAVVTTQGASTTFFQLYEAVATPNGWAVSPIVAPDGAPVSVAEGGSVTHQDGVNCYGPSNTFIEWSASPNADQTKYVIHSQPYRLDGDYESSPGVFTTSRVLQPLTPSDSTVDLNTDQPMPADDVTSCGGSIQNPSSP